MKELTLNEAEQVNGGIAATLAIVMIVSLFFKFLSK